MGGIELSFGNLWRLIAALSPILVGFFMLMMSLLNQNIKALVYLAGAILALFINIPIQQSIGEKISGDLPSTCSLISLQSMTNYDSPNSSSLFLTFTFAYLVLPMLYNNFQNYAIIVSLLIIIAIDATAKIESKCTNFGGAMLGSLLGFAFGCAWYLLFHSIGATSLLYNNEIESNAIVCNKPSQESFKCTLYKNGSPIPGFSSASALINEKS